MSKTQRRKKLLREGLDAAKPGADRTELAMRFYTPKPGTVIRLLPPYRDQKTAWEWGAAEIIKESGLRLREWPNLSFPSGYQESPPVFAPLGADHGA